MTNEEPKGVALGERNKGNMMRRLLTFAASRLALSGLAVGTSLGASLTMAVAEEIPWRGERVEIMARERPVAEVLRDVFAAEGLTATASGSVQGPLSGEFAGDARMVWEQLAEAFGLVAYYDGGAVRIYDGSEVGSRMYNLAPAVSRDVRRTLSEMNLTDADNTTRLTGDGVLIASGVPRFLQLVDGVVTARGLSRAESDATLSFEVFPLKHAWAQDTTQRFGSTEVSVPGVASIVRGLVADGSAAPVQATRTERRMTPVESARVAYREAGVAEVDLAAAQAAGAAPFGVRPRGARVDAPAAQALPSLPPGVRIEAEPRLNAVVVRDRPERMAIYRNLIAQLDQQSKIVAIEATIIDVDTDRLREVGVQWRFGSDDLDATLGGRLTRGLDLSPGDFVNPFTSGLLAAGVIGEDDMLSARVAALEAEGLARVVSSPQVITLANVEAVFNNTRTFFVRVASQFDAELFDVTVGTSLTVTPHVLEQDGEELVKLLVNVQSGRLTGDSVDGIPIVDDSGVGTQGVMRIGDSMLVGGLTVDRSESFEEGVPVLRSIPLLGRAFKQTSTRKGRVERMFLLTPRLVTPGGNVAVRLNDQGRAVPMPTTPSLPPALPEAAPLRPSEVALTAGAGAAAVPAVARSAASGEAALIPAPAPASDLPPLLRGGGLFSAACDDLDPYADCEV